ncbi:hypothetical protein Aab01nite_11570 [Paractinoplanes abujensis]|nr:hypothetical protein Aab01nite_11570 [Actinoplanes abujensis]
MPPADPWATINRPAPTVHFGDDPEATAILRPQGRPGPPPVPPSPDLTTPRSAPSPTVPSSPPYPPSSESTMRLAGPSSTVRSSGAGPVGHPAGADGGVPAPAIRAGGEVRFGPGVPAAPARAPGWPAPVRPRPRWRRLVSVLSGLVTLALIVVAGLHVWQRLSPIEVESVTVAVPHPAGSRCDVTVDVVATVRTNGRGGVIRYQWLRSDAPPGAVLTERVGRDQRVATLTLRWTFSGAGSTSETATVTIVEPAPLSSSAGVAYRCRPR